jgi:hypothetical protein
MRLLAERGLSLEDVIAVAAANEADRIDGAAEKRKAYDRERKAAKAAEKRNSTGIPTERADANSTGNSTGIPPETASLTRVGDNNLPTEVIYLTTPDDASADVRWPESNPPSKADLDRLEDALFEAGGAGLASRAIAPKIAVLAPILSLSRTGKGPPCDLQADVLPVIRARSARAPPGSIKSWEFFTAAICEARDRRLSGAPAQQVQHERDHNHPGRQTPNGAGHRTDANISGAALALARRAGA